MNLLILMSLISIAAVIDTLIVLNINNKKNNSLTEIQEDIDDSKKQLEKIKEDLFENMRQLELLKADKIAAIHRYEDAQKIELQKKEQAMRKPDLSVELMKKGVITKEDIKRAKEYISKTSTTLDTVEALIVLGVVDYQQISKYINK